MKIEKYLVKENPWAVNGKYLLKVTRETKTMYFCKVNDSDEMKFRKPKEEVNGAYVCAIPPSAWDMFYELVIKEVEE